VKPQYHISGLVSYIVASASSRTRSRGLDFLDELQAVCDFWANLKSRSSRLIQRRWHFFEVTYLDGIRVSSNQSTPSSATLLAIFSLSLLHIAILSDSLFSRSRPGFERTLRICRRVDPWYIPCLAFFGESLLGFVAHRRILSLYSNPALPFNCPTRFHFKEHFENHVSIHVILEILGSC
jgi:hypothetical protein